MGHHEARRAAEYAVEQAYAALENLTDEELEGAKLHANVTMQGHAKGVVLHAIAMQEHDREASRNDWIKVHGI